MDVIGIRKCAHKKKIYILEFARFERSSIRWQEFLSKTYPLQEDMFYSVVIPAVCLARNFEELASVLHMFVCHASCAKRRVAREVLLH